MKWMDSIHERTKGMAEKLHHGFFTSAVGGILFRSIVVPLIFVVVFLGSLLTMIFNTLKNLFINLFRKKTGMLLDASDESTQQLSLQSPDQPKTNTLHNPTTDRTVKYLYGTATLVHEEEEEPMTLSQTIEKSRREYEQNRSLREFIAGLEGIGGNMYAQATTISPDCGSQDQSRVKKYFPMERGAKSLENTLPAVDLAQNANPAPNLPPAIKPAPMPKPAPEKEVKVIRPKLTVTREELQFYVIKRPKPKIQKLNQKELEALRQKLLNPKSGGGGRTIRFNS